MSKGRSVDPEQYDSLERATEALQKLSNFFKEHSESDPLEGTPLQNMYERLHLCLECHAKEASLFLAVTKLAEKIGLLRPDWADLTPDNAPESTKKKMETLTKDAAKKLEEFSFMPPGFEGFK